jgi:hypothetical protein
MSTEPDWIVGAKLAARIQVAESLIAYVVDAYGVEMLPVLIDGFRQHRSWQTLVPAVFGQPVERFEQDWHNAVQADHATLH